ncbi:MAG: methyltransferase domain-containing protein [Raineya sp.]
MNLETIGACPICDYTSFTHFLTCKDYTVSQANFNLQKCKSCGFVLTSPRPVANEMASYYQSEAYISHSYTQKGLINWLYHKVRKIALRNKLALLEKYFPQKGKLLDNGCGRGAFVKFALDNGWRATGIEPDEKTRIFASQHTQSAILGSLAGLPTESKYQAITMWHVLEHIADLHEAIERMKAALVEKGLFFVALPNRESKDALYFKKYWAAYDVPRHLWHFSKKDVENLFAKHQLYIKAIYPMPFDAYYISMLSTKYQNGSVNYLRAVWQGLRSNWAGGRDNTSSLIYVIGN